VSSHSVLHEILLAKHLYQFEQEDVDLPQQVAFVLTLTAPMADADIYSSMTAQLGSYVESAVLEQEIDIQL